MSVCLFKKRDVTESRYGQNISSRSSSRKLGQRDDQGMRDGVHTGKRRKTAGSNAPGAFLVFFGGHLPQTSGFRSAKDILVVSFATAFILSDRNTFYTPPRGRGGRTTAGSYAPGAFLVFFWWSLAPDLRSVKAILAGNLRLFSVYPPEFSWKLVQKITGDFMV